MDLIKQGYEVLYIWNDQKIEEIEQQVNEMKKIASVKLENSERLSLGDYIHKLTKLIFNQQRNFSVFTASHSKSSFDVILVNISTISLLTEENLKLLMNLVKPKGKVAFNSGQNGELESALILSGFVNVNFVAANNCE